MELLSLKQYLASRPNLRLEIAPAAYLDWGVVPVFFYSFGSKASHGDWATLQEMLLQGASDSDYDELRVNYPGSAWYSLCLVRPDSPAYRIGTIMAEQLDTKNSLSP